MSNDPDYLFKLEEMVEMLDDANEELLIENRKLRTALKKANDLLEAIRIEFDLEIPE